MRNHVDLAAGNLEDFLQELGRELAHDDKSIREFRDLFHHHQLIRVWLAQNRMQGGHQRHLQAAQQMQNMASGWTAEDSILVLQAHHVDIVEVQKFGGFLIRSQIVLSKRPSHPRGIVVTFFGVIDRECQQSSIPVLRGDCAAQVGGECGDSTLPRKIISDYRDATG